jgi:hypothetical protein
VIDYEIDGLEWIDFSCVAAEAGECVAHRGEIDDGGYAGEVLKKNARGFECDFLLDFALHVPARERLDVASLDELPVFISEKVLQENLQAEGKGGCF